MAVNALGLMVSLRGLGNLPAYREARNRFF
jgi:hypothetical protein